MNRTKNPRSVYFLVVLLLLGSVTSAINQDSTVWSKIVKEQYILSYTKSVEGEIASIDKNLQSGLKFIGDFFRHSFATKFDVYIFPDRTLMDKQWQKEWDDPTFQSECWKIARGVAHRLDLLSPNAWAKQACEHNANDTIEIRQVTWHELVHVFHGQYNPDQTFNYVEKLDWLIEGVATFVSVQIDEKRLLRIKQMIHEGKTPLTLDDFLKGKERYGLSGSMITYIDKTFGREKLFLLLKFTNKQDVLKFLGRIGRAIN